MCGFVQELALPAGWRLTFFWTGIVTACSIVGWVLALTFAFAVVSGALAWALGWCLTEFLIGICLIPVIRSLQQQN
jgi:hypothetical protein